MTTGYSTGAYSYGGIYYGGGYYNAGYYGYAPPGSYLHAIYSLTGPGSSAYLSIDGASSYAYEGYYGNYYERDISSSQNSYSRSTSYYISDGSSAYSQETLSDYRISPSAYGTYGYGSYGYGIASVYSSIDDESYYRSGYKFIGSQSFTETNYTGGAYHDTYFSISGGYEDGMKVPGSETTYSSFSYGYLSSYPS